MDILNRLNIDLKRLDFFQKFIGLNILVFLSYRLLILFNYQSSFINFFSLDNNFFDKPWSIITYSFIHQGLFELIFMIILLLFTSNSIKNLLGVQLPIKIFIVGVLMGGIFFLFFNKSSGSLIGASAGISSLLIFLLLMSPDLSVRLFRFNLKFKYIMGLILFIDFLKLITPGEYGIFSHIGGYLVGIFYYFSLYGLPTLIARRKPRYNNRRKYSPTKQIKVDKILDKISKSGYDSLNKEEKEFLFKQGGKK